MYVIGLERWIVTPYSRRSEHIPRQHGTRPGYSQLEMEWKALTNIEAGLDALDRGEEIKEPTPKKQLSVMEFKKICEANQ